MAFDPTQYGGVPQGQTGTFNPANYGALPVQQPSNPGSNFIKSSVGDQFAAGVSQVKRGVSDLLHPQSQTVPGAAVNGAEAGLGIENGVASILTSPLAPLFAPVGKAVNFAADKISNIPQVQQFAQSGAGKTTARVAQDLANAGNVAGTITGAEAAVRGVPALAQEGAKAIDLMQNASSEGTAGSDSAIIDNFNKAVKPTTAGKTGPGQLDAFNNSVVSAVKSIAANKDALKLEDPEGTFLEGQLPTNRAQLADAVEQTKDAIFKQYDALTQQTTGKGVTISLEPAANALQDVIDNEALNITHPEAVSYAKAVQQRFQNPDGSWKAFDPNTIQEAITNYNSDLKAFYRNPTYGAASRAGIDAGVVSELRQTLSDAIENATGEDYTALKRQYGALATVEKDVNKAALTQLKKTGTIPSGLGKYIDIFSGGDMVTGLISLNPGLFAKGAAQAGINHFVHYLNSPDRAVQSMFKAVAPGK